LHGIQGLVGEGLGFLLTGAVRRNRRIFSGGSFGVGRLGHERVRGEMKKGNRAQVAKEAG